MSKFNAFLFNYYIIILRFLDPFRTFGGLQYGITKEKGMVAGRPIYENSEQGFDVRESLEMNFDTIKFVVVILLYILFHMLYFKHLFLFSKCLAL